MSRPDQRPLLYTGGRVPQPRVPARVPVPPALKKLLDEGYRMNAAHQAAEAELREANIAVGRAKHDEIERHVDALREGKPEPTESLVGAARERLELAEARAAAVGAAEERSCGEAWQVIAESRPELHAKVRKAAEERFAAAAEAHQKYIGALGAIVDDLGAMRWLERGDSFNGGRYAMGAAPAPPPAMPPPLDPNPVDPDAGEGPITRAARQRQRANQRPAHIAASLQHKMDVPPAGVRR
jgi:hypothetical protein